MTTQLPPADELFVVRVNIKALQERERELKALMNDPANRTGNDYCVELVDRSVEKTDYDELQIDVEKLQPGLWASHTHPITQRRVELRRITEDGEVVRIKRTKEKSDV